jgi:hypothetical protein
MNFILFLLLLTSLLVSIFVIIPKYAPAKQQTLIKDWVGLGFNGILLFWALAFTRGNDIMVPAVFYVFVVALCVSGVYWWIPTYVKPDEQNNAISTMFLSVTLAIILSQNMSPSMAITAGRRLLTRNPTKL